MSTADELSRMFAEPERKARLLAAAEAALEAKITEELKWGLPDTLSKICADFIEAEIAPQVRDHLASRKGVILEAAIAATDEIGEELAKKLVTKATENLAGYRGSDILKALFT